MNKEYDVVLFDLDGTLTDPKIGITKSVQHALKSFGIIEENLDNLEKFIGPPLKDSFKEYYGFEEEKAVLAVEKYREYFSVKGIYENSPYEMIEKLLQNLKFNGKKLIVATSKPTVFADQILKHFKLYHYFDFVAGSNLDGSRVKKDEVIQYALESCNISKAESIVMIGDRMHDIMGANKTGIDSIGVLYGYGSLEEHKAENATFIVNSVQELIDLLIKDAA
jgi:haloacid dehalogenase superfamily, subfamily IA, variant 1 with third motif having Dx(3-4)D or Dx(3-4)E